MKKSPVIGIVALVNKSEFYHQIDRKQNANKSNLRGAEMGYAGTCSSIAAEAHRRRSSISQW
jgi:hypothetical protein